MAIRLGATDTHIVLTALWDYRETLTNDIAPNPPHIQARIARVDRLIASYRKSFVALDRLGLM
jgi:hypothetical protein